MVEFAYQTDFKLYHAEFYRQWAEEVVLALKGRLAQLLFVFCDDEYLHDINLKHLGHDTYTDIISFDYSVGDLLQMEIYISVERVLENAMAYGAVFEEELRRVMSHGILHGRGHGDKTEEERQEMRRMEEEMMKLFHVEQN